MSTVACITGPTALGDGDAAPDRRGVHGGGITVPSALQDGDASPNCRGVYGGGITARVALRDRDTAADRVGHDRGRITGRIGSQIGLGDGDVAHGTRAAHGGGITAPCALGDGEIAAVNAAAENNSGGDVGDGGLIAGRARASATAIALADEDVAHGSRAAHGGGIKSVALGDGEITGETGDDRTALRVPDVVAGDQGRIGRRIASHILLVDGDAARDSRARHAGGITAPAALTDDDIGRAKARRQRYTWD